jgi:hypothetical protein
MKHLLFSLTILLTLSVSAGLWKPEDFGAIVDDNKPDDMAFQAMFDAIPFNERNVVIELYPGEYLFAETVFYPKYNRRRMLIDGRHATLKMVGREKDILSPKGIAHESVGTALENIDKLVVRDLSFEGGDTQLRLAATLNSEIENCEFHGGNRGADLVFCLMARVINCQFTRQKKEQLLVRSGQGDIVTGAPKYFSNATGQNSQSNVVTVDGCRFFSEQNAHACIRNYASNSMNITNTVFEGLAPKHAVDYDDRNSTTCTYFYMHNIHIEHPMDPFTQSLIKVVQNGGLVHLDGIYSQTGRTVQVEAGGSIVKLSNWAYFPGGFKFKANKGGEWIFEDNKGLQGFDLASEGLWVGKPPYYIVDRYAGNTHAHSGYSVSLRNKEDYFSLEGDRINHTTSYQMDTGEAPSPAPKNLDNFEIGHMKRYVLIDPETGEQRSYFIPLLQNKKEEQ